MTLADQIAFVRRRWMILVAATLAGLTVAVLLSVFRDQRYSADTTLYVAAQAADTASAAYQGSLLSEQRIVSYRELVQSPRVLEQTVERLGLSETPDKLAQQVQATSAPDSVLLTITATETDPKMAADIANVTADVFVELVNDLERPTTPTEPQTVSVKLVQRAAIPASSSSTPVILILLIGGLAGLVAGAAAATAIDKIDTRIRTTADLERASGVPVLASVASDSSIASPAIVVNRTDVSTATVEAFKRLRTNLEFVDVDNTSKVIALSSSLPSEGKSTTTVNLAAALALAGHRVLIIDADLRRPTIADIMNVESSVGLSTVLSGRINVDRAIQKTPNAHLDVLASGQIPPNPSELLGSQNMRSALELIRGRYDTILIDSPPLLPVTDAAAMSVAIDGFVLICKYNGVRKEQVEASASALARVEGKLYGCVLTMAPPPRSAAYATYYHPKPTADNADTTEETPLGGGRDIEAGWVRESEPRRPVPHRRT